MSIEISKTKASKYFLMKIDIIRLKKKGSEKFLVSNDLLSCFLFVFVSNKNNKKIRHHLRINLLSHYKYQLLRSVFFSPSLSFK